MKYYFLEFVKKMILFKVSGFLDHVVCRIEGVGTSRLYLQCDLNFQQPGKLLFCLYYGFISNRADH